DTYERICAVPPSPGEAVEHGLGAGRIHLEHRSAAIRRVARRISAPSNAIQVALRVKRRTCGRCAVRRSRKRMQHTLAVSLGLCRSGREDGRYQHDCQSQRGACHSPAYYKNPSPMLSWIIHKSTPILMESFAYVFRAALAHAPAMSRGSTRNGLSETSGQSPQGVLRLNRLGCSSERRNALMQTQMSAFCL